MEGCYKVTPEPCLLQAEQPHLSELVLIGEVVQPSDHLHGSPLDPLQHIHVLLMMRAPELDAELQVRSHESEGAESPPLPCWPRFSWCSPGHGRPSGLPAHIAGSRPAFHLSVPPSPSQQSCSRSFVTDLIFSCTMKKYTQSVLLSILKTYVWSSL